MDNNEQKVLKLQAELYRAIKEYYPSLDALAKKLQDDYNGDEPFVQHEEDRLGLCFILDYYDDIEGQIRGLQSDKTITAEEEHKKEVDETTDMITAEDIVEQAVYTANAPECCSEDHAENMLSMLGANIVDENVFHHDHPSQGEQVDEMSRLADRYVKQAVNCQLDGIGRIRYYDIQGGTSGEHFDEEIFLNRILAHPEIEKAESDDNGYVFTIAEAYRSKEEALRGLDEDEV